MLKFYTEPPEVKDRIEYVWIDGKVSDIFSPYQFSLVAEGRRFYCDYTHTEEPSSLEVHIEKQYSVQGHITGKVINGAEELWLTGIPVPEEVIKHRRKQAKPRKLSERELELISYGEELPFGEYQLELEEVS